MSRDESIVKPLVRSLAHHPMSPFFSTSRRALALALSTAIAGAAASGCAQGGLRAKQAPDHCGDFVRTGHATRDLASLVRSCGPGLPVTPPLEQPAQAIPQRFAFEAAGEGRCYRVLAVGDAGVTALGLRVRDPQGRNLVETETPRAFGVVPERALLCLPEPGFYYVDVAVLGGRGGYALQVLESQ